MPNDDPLWYKDAILYELHVRAFHDTSGDGIGDFRGLTQKLDYLADLGITAIWLLPFYPSPLRDDGYDIADYTEVHPNYGRISDFKEFLDEAHRRGLRVVTELVINHTSDQHPWFQRARRAPAGSPERDFYVWSDSPDKYSDARIIFKDFEHSNWAWDPVAKSYYWHRFYSHQPDLNFDNPAVWQALFPVLDFWMEMGVDGMRLDAIPYLYEREGTNCENLPETHAFLKALRQRIDKRFPGRMLLAEANQWPEDAVAYFGDGDECHMSFHFPLMPRLFMALHQEDRFPILDILAQTPPIPESAQWCMFLRNHDELTLEMVTDEERDYMYRAYAQDRTARINLGIRHRLAPLLKNDRRRIELMNALLFSMPGSPVVYYGDEIGMGDNIHLGDRDGVRTPMQWSGDRNAGFSRANPQKLYLPVIIDPEHHYEAVNVEAQQNNPSSLLWWTKRLIAIRKRFQAFGRGAIEFLKPANPKILAFTRRDRDETLLIVANLSRFAQCAELDLRAYEGTIPEEMFSGQPFPAISSVPYFLTLGPHGFFWFALTAAKPPELAALEGSEALPVLALERSWRDWLDDPASWDKLAPILPAYLRRRGTYAPDSEIASASVLEVVPMPLPIASGLGSSEIRLVLVRLEFREGAPETSAMVLTLVRDEDRGELLAPVDQSAAAVISGGPTPGLLCDAMTVASCCRSVLDAMFAQRRRRLADAEIAATLFDPIEDEARTTADQSVILRHGERRNSAIIFGDRFFLKTFRRMEEGANPDLEISRHLADHTKFVGYAPVLGCIEYQRDASEPSTLAILHRYVENEGTAWQLALDQLSGCFEKLAALGSGDRPPQPPVPRPLLGSIGPESNERSAEDEEGLAALNGALEFAGRLGSRTAELHQALADDRSRPAFVPEPFGKLYQRSVYQSMRNIVARFLQHSTSRRSAIPEAARPLADRLALLRDAALARFRTIIEPEFASERIRCHGDLHLDQWLYTGKDFLLMDFVGDERKSIADRKVKRSPLRDVASMIRSFDYASQSVLLGLASRRSRSPGVIRPEDRRSLEPWAEVWHNRVARAFATAYAAAIAGSGLLPRSESSQLKLLELFLLEQALRDADFELANRPDWAEIPLRSALRILETSSSSSSTPEKTSIG